MKISNTINQSTQKTNRANFGMALTVSSRAINNSAIFPNAHADLIRDAYVKASDRLEKLAKKYDIKIDVDPADRGFDWKGEHNVLSVAVGHLDKNRGEDQFTRLLGAIKDFFTKPFSFVKIDATDLAKASHPDEVIVKMAEEAIKRL